MRYIFVFFLWVDFAFGFAQQADTIKYQPERRLKWVDFEGDPDYSDSGKAAQISTTILLQSDKVNFWTGRTQFVGTALMYKDKSWVKPGFKNDYVLAHEQLHFDIAYIAVKKLESDINTLSVNILNKSIIDAMFRNWHAIFLLQEKTYDLMTDGGNDAEMQKYYQKKIARELKVLQQTIF